MIAKAIQKLDQIPEYRLILVNLGIAAFVGLAHAGGLAITLAQEPEHLDKILPLAIVSLPLAGFVIISSVIILLRRRSPSAILATHAIILCLGGAAAFIWAGSILVKGIPEGRFAWSPGLMTFFCVYPVYLLRRTLLRKKLPHSATVRYLHVVVLIVALIVDVGVFVKFCLSPR